MSTSLPHWRFRVEFKPADCWIGVFWRWLPSVYNDPHPWRFDLWLCVVPMLPLHLAVWQRWWTPRPAAAPRQDGGEEG